MAIAKQLRLDPESVTRIVEEIRRAVEGTSANRIEEAVAILAELREAFQSPGLIALRTDGIHDGAISMVVEPAERLRDILARFRALAEA